MPRRELGTLTKTLGGGGGGNDKRRARLAAKRDRLAAEVAEAEATLQRLMATANTAASSIAAAVAAAVDAAGAAGAVDAAPESFEESVRALAPAAALLPHSRRERTAERAAHSEALRRRLCVWQQAAVAASNPDGERLVLAAEVCVEAMLK